MRPDSFLLEPISPFRLDLTAWTLRRRPDNVVDRWDGQTYRRVLPLLAGFAEVAVTQSGPPETPQLRVTVDAATLCLDLQQAVTTVLERLLGFRTNLAAFYSLARRDTALGPLAERFRGMKPPRFATVFESVITAIANQQVTLTVGVLLLNRLAVSHGAVVHEGHAAAYAFPQANQSGNSFGTRMADRLDTRRRFDRSPGAVRSNPGQAHQGDSRLCQTP
jgi:DNA-3-methyladenine glycosylase II